MKKRKTNNNKAERRQWWYSLSPERQQECIKYWIKQKGEDRKVKSLKLMQKHKNKYSCKSCLHGLNGHCTDILPYGCEYWFNPQSKITGLAYPNAGVNPANKHLWLEKIKRKNPWLKAG